MIFLALFEQTFHRFEPPDSWAPVAATNLRISGDAPRDCADVGRRHQDAAEAEHEFFTMKNSGRISWFPWYITMV